MYPVFLTSLLFATAALRPLLIVDPGYPPNALRGGTVVVQLLLFPGAATKATILTGDGAFAESAAAALSAWRFAAKQKTPMLAVVHFRDPNFYSTGPATRSIEPGPPPNLLLAYPKTVIDPVYPANSLGEGSVVIQADVAPTGAVIDVVVIKGAGGLAQASLDAVRRWSFFPAKDARGRPTASTIYAVLVFRIPINAPVRPGK